MSFSDRQENCADITMQEEASLWDEVDLWLALQLCNLGDSNGRSVVTSRSKVQQNLLDTMGRNLSCTVENTTFNMYVCLLG